MTSVSLLNLTLDEIIQRTRKEEKSNVSNLRRGKGKGGKNGVRLNRNRQFQKKGNLSLSLSSRLSGGGGGFKRINGDLRRNITVQNRLRSLPDSQRMSVHNRLTLNTNSPRQLPRSPISLQSRMLPRTRNLKTRNCEDSQPVRITNGAIVKGLRSDQLLLQKLNQHQSLNLRAKMEKLRSLQMKGEKLTFNCLLKRSEMVERSLRKDTRANSSKVSLNMDRGLTVRIANEVVKRTKPSLRAKRPVTPSSSSSSSPSSSSSEEGYQSPRTSRRSTETAKEYSSAPSLLRLGVERPPPPKPHRQVLDQQIQKEIAVLQGFFEPQTGGPGPGVKGFKMVPCKTRHTLNDRFTMERTVE